jgi:Mn2+/Fe2+ NRAMP family transporter
MDLVILNWLTMVTEFIGVTASLQIFGVPPILSVAGVWLLMGFMVLSGRYWTWEKVALFFCIFNLIYIPAAFLLAPMQAYANGETCSQDQTALVNVQACDIDIL